MPDLAGSAPKKATKYDFWAYVLIGVFGLPLLAAGIGALVLPPGISFSLVRRGLAEGKLSWTILGGLTGLIWLLLLFLAGKKIMKPAPTTTPTNGETPR